MRIIAAIALCVSLASPAMAADKGQMEDETIRATMDHANCVGRNIEAIDDGVTPVETVARAIVLHSCAREFSASQEWLLKINREFPANQFAFAETPIESVKWFEKASIEGAISSILKARVERRAATKTAPAR